MSKQTAVEYLIEQLLPKALGGEQYYHIEIAKEMNKQDIVDAYRKGYREGLWREDLKDAYNEIYGGDEFPQEEPKVKLTQSEFKDAFFGKAKSKGGDK